MAIPEKLALLRENKAKIKAKIESTGLSTQGKTFRDYADLIEDIPNTGAITPSQVDTFTQQAINISGEEA